MDTSLSNAQKAALAATDVNGGPLPPNPASGPSSLPVHLLFKRLLEKR